MHIKTNGLVFAVFLYLCGSQVFAEQAEYAWPACGHVDQWPDDQWPDDQWPEGTDTTSWDNALLQEAEAQFNEGDSAAMMVIWQGQKIASWGEVEEPYLIQSVRKPVINMVAGQLYDEGTLKLSQTLADLEIQDYEPPLSDLNLSATVENVLTSRSGIYHSAHYEVGGWKRARSELSEMAYAVTGEPSYPPGQVWVYNNWDFNAAGEIVRRLSQTELPELIGSRVAEPLNMQDFEPDHVQFEEDGNLTAWMMDNHSAIPAYVIEMSTRDLARIGLLYLGCGQWDDKRILSEEWVRASTKGIPVDVGAPADFPWNRGRSGYGFLWFVEAGEKRGAWLLDHLPPYYYHSGYRGHMLYVMPHLDLVIVHQVATSGGVGFTGQLKRNLFGSPEVPNWQIEIMVAKIIAAHPDPKARNAAGRALQELREYRESRENEH